MDVVDAQVHLWGPHTPARPWPADVVKRLGDTPPWTAERILAAMDEAGVRRAVIVPPNWDGGRNDLALAAAAAHPDRFAVMGKFDIDRPADPSLLATWKQQKGMVGLRFNVTDKVAKQFVGGAVDWIWRGAQEHTVPVALLAPGVLDHVGVIASRYPELKLAVDHMATALGQRDDAAFVHLPELLELARYANVCVKVSALPCNTSEPYPFRNLHDRIRSVYDRFGPDRMFWGSDLTRLTGPYRECVSLFTQELPWLSEADKRLIMGEAMARWLGWPL